MHSVIAINSDQNGLCYSIQVSISQTNATEFHSILGLTEEFHY